MDVLDVTRREWSEMMCFCMLCGYSSPSGRNLDTHEIASGAGRQGALEEPAAWLRLCNGFVNGCHARLQGIAEVAIPLALKKIADPDHYDRVAVNRLRGRADDAVTEAEVSTMVDACPVDSFVRPLTRREVEQAVAQMRKSAVGGDDVRP